MITKGILGTKGATEQVFSKDGDRVPATRIHTSPSYIVGMKTQSTDGYWALQVAFGRSKHIKKSQQGLLTQAGVTAPLRFIREIRFDSAEEVQDGKSRGLKVADHVLTVGQELKPSDLFAEGERVTATGTSKGKGFQGVVKRHGFAGGKRTHGQSDRERAPGSIGSGTTIGRVFKGKKMAGRMGTDTVTIKNLEVLSVDDEGITLKGVLPGVPGGLVIIRAGGGLPEKIVEEVVDEATPETEEVSAEAPVADEEVDDAPAANEEVVEAPAAEVSAETPAADEEKVDEPEA